jgi:hypothetical protein
MHFIRRRRGPQIIAAALIAAAAIVVPTTMALASSGGAAAASVPQCQEGDTYVWLALAADGASGTYYYPVEFTNIGSRSCWLYGFPGVAAITATARRFGPAAGRFSMNHGRVTIRPDQTAYALLGIVENGTIRGCKQAEGAGLQVYPPNQKDSQFVFNFTFPACRNKVYMHVFPVAPGIGVP